MSCYVIFIFFFSRKRRHTRFWLDGSSAVCSSDPDPSATPAAKPFAPEVPLTRRESDVLDELLQGQSNRQIGKNLFISEDTVKSHVKAILRKLGARDRAHAVSLVLSGRNQGDRKSVV